MTTTELRHLFEQMCGPDESDFFRTHWRQRTRFAKAALKELSAAYSHESFLADYHRVAPLQATLLASVDSSGHRKMFRPSHLTGVDDALGRGMSVVLQALLLPPAVAAGAPTWKWLISEYDSLCEYVFPDFNSRGPLGGAVAALDIFCTATSTSIGGHYDTGDVFYFMLDGEKEWTVELAPDSDVAYKLAAEGTNYRFDRPSLNKHMVVRIEPGDCLYVPPYTYHRIRSFGRTLAVSFGLPSFTEVVLLKTALNLLQNERLLYTPLPSFPKTQGALYLDARKEVEARVRRTLDLLGGATIAEPSR